MKVRWHRVMAAVLVIVGMVFCATHGAAISEFFAGMRHIGSRDREQHMMGLIAFGVLLFLLAVFGRLVLHGRSE